MRKFAILCGFFAGFSSYVYAANESDLVVNNAESNEYGAFQKFDRQYSLGFGAFSGNLSAAGTSGGNYSATFLNFDVERLFNVGVWMDINAYLYSSYRQSPNVDPAVGMTGQLTGADPQFGGVNAKVGYAFPLLKDKILLTPYGQFGRNVNLSSYTLQATPVSNLTSDYYWTFGAGARLEYRINDVIDIYLDQNMVYNLSQANMTQGLAQANFYNNRTVLGGKFNLYRNFQLGAQAFYNNYSYQENLVSANPVGAVALAPDNNVGGMISFGLTY
ncbi:MAG: hypothetical protein PHC75_04870 [Burkholderiales bacterium]|nr:hypothetical protein [Burkholderiales bacterium]